METFLEILKFTVPSVIVMIGMYFLLGEFFNQEDKKREFSLRQELVREHSKISLPLRLQAYERMVMLMERIHPTSLIQRVRMADMNSGELHLALIRSIREEFEYNISQQIYISKESWLMVNTAKEEMLKLINLIAAKVPSETNSIELTKTLFDYFVSTNQEFPSQLAINFLKEDVKHLF